MGPDKMTSLCSQILELLTASKRILQNISCCEKYLSYVLSGVKSPLEGSLTFTIAFLSNSVKL